MTAISHIPILVLARWTLSVSAQGISDTSGWALRIKDNCLSGQAECGKTAYGFVACCPSSSPCINQYNDVCCPPGPNCTDTLVNYGPFCADPSWVLCDNNGYFCCLPGQICYNEGNTDGCISPDGTLGPSQVKLDHLEQVQRPLATTTTSTKSTSTKSTSTTSKSTTSTSTTSTSTTNTSTTRSSSEASASAKPSTLAKMGTSATTSTSATISTSSQTSESATTSIAPSALALSTKPAQNPSSNGLSTSDKIAIGIGVPVGAVTIFGVWITWRMYDYRKQIVAKLLSARGTKNHRTQNTFPEEYLLSG